MNEAKITLLAHGLANLCLEEGNQHHSYNDEDLLNATLIFTHFIMDLMYTKHMSLPLEKQMILAEETGNAVRELIKKATGKDMFIVTDKVLGKK